MEWNNTRNYIKNSKITIPIILTVVTPATISFATKDWGGMISFYCIAGNPFLGSYLQRYANCPVYATIGFIVAITIAVSLIGFLLSGLVDFLVWIFKINKGNPEGKIRLPEFRSTHSNFSEIIIKDSNADNVAKFFLQYLQNLRPLADKSGLRLQLKESLYYDPQKYNTVNHVFVINGEKRIETHYSSDEANFTNFQMTEMPEVFFVTVIQGGRYTTQVKFESDDSDIFLLISDGILKELKKIFDVKEKGTNWWMS